MIRTLVIILLSASALLGSDSRNGLLFDLNSALATHNREALAGCFNFAGVDDATRRGILAAIDIMAAWPSHHVFTSERSGQGDLKMTRDGIPYTLNGDWQFQIHIFKSEQQPSRGFVFPAGVVAGRTVILLTVARSH